MLKAITPIGKICHICDESGKFFDEKEKEIRTPWLFRDCEKGWRKSVLEKASKEHKFCKTLIKNLDKKKEVASKNDKKDSVRKNSAKRVKKNNNFVMVKGEPEIINGVKYPTKILKIKS